MSIICPNCHHEEPEGSIYCVNCGTKLINSGGLSTAAIRTTDTFRTTDQLAESVDVSPKPAAPIPVTGAQLNLHIIRTGQILPLEGRSTFTIGRVSEGQSILPDIDLSPFDAYTQGVSRLHATLKIKDDQYFIEDLGSSNGTRINNNKIPPLADHLIHHGDVISLGRFKIQALMRQD